MDRKYQDSIQLMAYRVKRSTMYCGTRDGIAVSPKRNNLNKTNYGTNIQEARELIATKYKAKNWDSFCKRFLDPPVGLTKFTDEAAELFMQSHREEYGRLFEFLIQHGGRIVSSTELNPDDIAQARASGRMFVDINSLGYIWKPPLDKFPETIEEVKQEEKWYPLVPELPDDLKEPPIPPFRP